MTQDEGAGQKRSAPAAVVIACLLATAHKCHQVLHDLLHLWLPAMDHVVKFLINTMHMQSCYSFLSVLDGCSKH